MPGQKNKRLVFISYSHRDKEKVLLPASHLGDLGLRVGIDPNNPC